MRSRSFFFSFLRGREALGRLTTQLHPSAFSTLQPVLPSVLPSAMGEALPSGLIPPDTVRHDLPYHGQKSRDGRTEIRNMGSG